MPTLNIKDAEVRQLAHELAARTGQTMTEAVKGALREKLDREGRHHQAHKKKIVAEILERAEALSRLPVLDPRSPDEIIGYDEHGLPK